MGRALIKAMVCGAAGFVAWILTEPFFPKTIPAGNWTLDPAFTNIERWFVYFLGLLIGGSAGVLNGLERGGKKNVMISTGLGIVFGAAGAGFGHTIAGAVYSLFGGGFGNGNVIARTFAFLPFGVTLGAAVGASQRSLRTLVSGAIGGAIGGFVTGAVFDVTARAIAGLMPPIATANVPAGFQAETGAPARAVMAFGLGLMIGLFTALMDWATRRAWVRLVLGRNEGKEWPVDAAQTLIGRDERAHIPLFGDPSVPALAAVIVKQGGQYLLQDPGSPIGVGHNGVRVPQAVLSSGDTFQIGTMQFQFLMKSGSAGAHEGRAKGVPVGGTAPYQGFPQGVPPPAQAPQPYGYQQPPTQPTVAMPQAAPQPTMVYPAQPQPSQPTVMPGYGAMTLVAVTGPLTGQRFPVAGAVELGREATGVSLGFDSQASRRHASVSPAQGGLQVMDLGSTNGTFVNGQRVQTAFLRPGDTLTVGSTQFRLE
ncbi:MAG: FHA domain-containing protein [Armatimonadetes bacterium]|nr:FHA domain-containing protein [Armatimonadota bacterium]